MVNSTRRNSLGDLIDDALEANLHKTIALLEVEREALLAADAATVFQLSMEKERLSFQLSRSIEGLDSRAAGVSHILDLARRLNIIARENHVLIRQLYVQYRGFAAFFERLAGISPIYERSGRISLGAGPDRVAAARTEGEWGA